MKDSPRRPSHAPCAGALGGAVEPVHRHGARAHGGEALWASRAVYIADAIRAGAPRFGIKPDRKIASDGACARRRQKFFSGPIPPLREGS